MDIGEILKQTNWSLCWLKPKICQLLTLSILNCFCDFSLLVKCEILNFADVGKHMCTASMTTCPLSVERLDTVGHVNFFYFNILFHQYSVVCVLSKNILHKLAVP